MLCFFIYGANKIYAQKGFNVGLGGSYNSVWVINQNVYGMPEIDYDKKFGTAFMLGVGYNFNEWLGLRFELGKAALGQNYYEQNKGIVSDRKLDLKYTMIPVFLRLATTGEKAKFHIMLGPQLGILNSAEQEYSIGNKDVANKVKVNDYDYPIGETEITNRFEKSDLFAVLDFGLDFFFTERLYLNASLRLNYGLTDINVADWRIPNKDKEYKASNNAYGGLNFGLNYVLKYWY
ncbi:MAG: PorT family protein [Bacteroidales bacterium]|nr:PorT family protein [Bacteroidales bacterium]